VVGGAGVGGEGLISDAEADISDWLRRGEYIKAFGPGYRDPVIAGALAFGRSKEFFSGAALSTQRLDPGERVSRRG
jgi:hypothetical protein